MKQQQSSAGFLDARAKLAVTWIETRYSMAAIIIRFIRFRKKARKGRVNPADRPLLHHKGLHLNPPNWTRLLQHWIFHNVTNTTGPGIRG